MIKKSIAMLACAGALGLAMLATRRERCVRAGARRSVLALPGVPPIFATVIAYVAQKEGLFKKYGADVELRQFDNGTAAARAVVAGDVDIALSPTPPVDQSGLQCRRSAGRHLRLQQSRLGSRPPPKPAKTCKDIVGQAVGVDIIGGARSVALQVMLVGCP